jgi:epoxyqueuosine reductase
MSSLVSQIVTIALEQGFHQARILPVSRLLSAVREHLTRDSSLAVISSLSRYFGNEVIETRSSFSLLVCGLSCYRDESVPDPSDNGSYEHGLIAHFARRNYYREAVKRLAAVYRELHSGSRSRRNMHIFSNSMLPEKLFAWASGIGWYGKNSLIINGSLGSRFVISGLLIETDADPDEIEPGDVGAMCGECRACIDSCPVHAIREHGVIDSSRCMQALAPKMTVMPEHTLDSWGRMIYGCEICQNACPHNRTLTLSTTMDLGEIGPALPLRMLLGSSDEELKAFFRNTALGLSWIDPHAIRRNALIASGNSHNESLVPDILRFTTDPDPNIRNIAEWALRKLKAII